MTWAEVWVALASSAHPLGKVLFAYHTWIPTSKRYTNQTLATVGGYALMVWYW